MSFDRKAYYREYYREYRQRRRDNKLCLDCGKQDERTLQGKTRCKECAEKGKAHDKIRNATRTPEQIESHKQEMKESRELLKRLHLCIDCKQQDAYTLMGRVRCAECAAKNAKQTTESRQQRGIKSDTKAYRDKWRSEGRCTGCGKPKSGFDGYMLCCECRATRRNHNAEQRRLKYLELDDFPGTPGRCTYCGEPVVEGKKVCAKHYASRLDSMAKAREKAKETVSEHPWKKYSRFSTKSVKKGESDNV